MNIFSRYLHYARRSQVLLSRFNELRGFCDDRELLARLRASTQNITLTFIRNITELELDETFASFYEEIIDGNNLSIVIELYENFGHIISAKYENHPRKRVFIADFVLIGVELIRLKLLLEELEEELIADVKLEV
jgi:hypothetical protein